jgi:hypothetical protein
VCRRIDNTDPSPPPATIAGQNSQLHAPVQNLQKLRGDVGAYAATTAKPEDKIHESIGAAVAPTPQETDLTPLSTVGEQATGEIEEGRRTLYSQAHRCRHPNIAAAETNSSPTYSIYTTRLQIRGPHSLTPPERQAEGARTGDLVGGERVEREGFFSPPQSGERGGAAEAHFSEPSVSNSFCVITTRLILDTRRYCFQLLL